VNRDERALGSVPLGKPAENRAGVNQERVPLLKLQQLRGGAQELPCAAREILSDIRASLDSDRSRIARRIGGEASLPLFVELRQLLLLICEPDELLQLLAGL
jgi:hypothetical protein